jgi:hypothetical protein
MKTAYFKPGREVVQLSEKRLISEDISMPSRLSPTVPEEPLRE